MSGYQVIPFPDVDKVWVNITPAGQLGCQVWADRSLPGFEPYPCCVTLSKSLALYDKLKIGHTKVSGQCWVWWYIPIILARQEVVVGGSRSETSQGQKAQEAIQK